MVEIVKYIHDSLNSHYCECTQCHWPIHVETVKMVMYTYILAQWENVFNKLWKCRVSHYWFHRSELKLKNLPYFLFLKNMDFLPSMEPIVGLELMSLRLRPELRSRVQHSANGAMQASCSLSFLSCWGFRCRWPWRDIGIWCLWLRSYFRKALYEDQPPGL